MPAVFEVVIRSHREFKIIDKATYNKLTEKFTKNGSIIITNKEVETHLDKVGATAAYLWESNIAFIREDATVFDVIEKMYHAEQDRKHLFSEYSTKETLLRREIDAQHHLLKLSEKYKIPLAEIEVTKKNLSDYEKELDKLLKGGGK